MTAVSAHEVAEEEGGAAVEGDVVGMTGDAVGVEGEENVD